MVFENHRAYLILVTSYPALTWLFKNHALSSKPRRWAVKLAKYYIPL